MSGKERKKKKQQPPKPWYTKYQGYRFVESALHESKKNLLSAGKLLNDIRSIDRGDLLVGEIQSLEAVDKKVSEAVPAIVNEYTAISKALLDFVKVKRALNEMDFKPLVDKTMTFIDLLISGVVEPMGEADSIVSSAILRNKPKETSDVTE